MLFERFEMRFVKVYTITVERAIVLVNKTICNGHISKNRK